MIFPLEKVILRVAGINTELNTIDNLVCVGFEFDTKENKIISTIWRSESVQNNFVMLYQDNTYHSFEMDDNKKCVGINNNRIVFRTEGLYDSMPTKLKEKIIDSSLKDKIVGWYEENNNLILNILGDTDVG
jgi:hypothetical protein